MDYNDTRNKLAKVLPRFILNGMDFLEGFIKGFHYTYVGKGRWYRMGYALSYRLTGWYALRRDQMHNLIHYGNIYGPY